MRGLTPTARRRLRSWAGRPRVGDAILRALLGREVARQRAAQIAHGVVIVGAPDARSPIPAAGEYEFAVMRKGHREDRICMATESAEFLAGGHIPEPRGLIRAGGRQPLAVGREGDSVEDGRVTHKAAEFLAGGYIP